MSGERLNPFQHARKRPDTYIGSRVTVSKKVWLFDETSKKASLEEVDFNPGLYAVVREIISNAIDNVWRSQENGVPMTKIEITVDRMTGSVSVWNDGYCIPARKQKYAYKEPRTGKMIEENLYPAEVFFGDMFSGTNYDDDEVRKTSGRNGMGAKAANVFSTEFRVEHISPGDKKKFVQVFRNGGQERDEPEVTTTRTKKGYTLISFIPDVEYFEYPEKDGEELDGVFVRLLKLYAYEVAMITGIRVRFVEKTEEGETKAANITVPSMEKYVRLFYPTAASNKLVSFEAPNGDEAVLVERGDMEDEESPDIEHTSFVNGIRTRVGGIHVNKWRDTIVPAIRKGFNDRKPPRGLQPVKTTARQLFPLFHLFVRTEVDRPGFSSQTKEELTEMQTKDGEKVGYTLFNARLKKEREGWGEDLKAAVIKILKWKSIERLSERLRSRADTVRARTQKVTKGRLKGISEEKYSKANEAGGPKSADCTLYITEGNSAKTFAEAAITSTPDGRDFNGCLAARGKIKSIGGIRGKKTKQAQTNAELQMLIKVLGLRDGVDYTKDANLKTLRYGRVRFMTDADDDGVHIRALLLAFFTILHPGIIARGRVSAFSTPVVEVTLGKPLIPRGPKVHSFYVSVEAKQWLKSQKLPANTAVKYWKGLGSIPSSRAHAYFSDPKLVTYTLDDEAAASVAFGFAAEESNARKKHIVEGNHPSKYFARLVGCEGSSNGNGAVSVSSDSEPDFSDSDADSDNSDSDSDDADSDDETVENYVYDGHNSVTDFIHNDLRVYWRQDVRRHLPCLWDGFNEAQRKILFGLHAKKIVKPRKLVQTIGAVMDVTGYHQGETSLYDVAVRMANGYVGANNIPFLVNEGQFGSRLAKNNNAAPRYLQTCLEAVVRSIFPKVDEALFRRHQGEEGPIEFEHYMPVIPTLLINGANSPASGWMTDIPAYDPEEIADWIRTWLDEDGDAEVVTEENGELKPWYRGFTGDIELIKNAQGKATGWYSKGKMRKITSGEFKGWWEVSELPIGVKTTAFLDLLEQMETGVKPMTTLKKDKDGKEIKKAPPKNFVKKVADIRNYSTLNTVRILFKPAKGFEPDPNFVKNFTGLRKKHSLNNLVAIDDRNYPHNFDTVEEMLDVFCCKRLDMYVLRKKYLLSKLEHDRLMAAERARFVKAVIDKKITIDDLTGSDEKVAKFLGSKKWKFAKIETEVETKKVESDDESDEDEGGDSLRSYSYLLSMSFRSLTQKRFTSLTRKVKETAEKLEEMKKVSPKKMWRDDLEAFEKAYRKFLTTRKDDGVPPKPKKKK